MTLGIQIWKIDRKNNEMAIEFEIDVKFGWFFVKKGFNFNASFDHPRGSNFYLLNLFFWSRRAIITQEQKKSVPTSVLKI